MVSEITINRLENVLTEVIDFSGTKEQTTIISNMEVVNAAPTGLSGFVTIRDDRDNDIILASKVPGVLYANGDLVNVLFIDGTEPIAFQQASASGGDPVAVSKLVSPDLLIDPVISADNAGDVTLAGTGDLILPDDIIHSGDTDTLISLEDDKIVLQAGGLEMVSIIEAATDEVVINDAQGDINFRIEGDGEDNLFFTDAGNDRIAIFHNAPNSTLHLDETYTDSTVHAAVRFEQTWSPSSTSGSQFPTIMQLNATYDTTHSPSGGFLTSFRLFSAFADSGVLNVRNVDLRFSNNGAGTIAVARDINIRTAVNNGGGAITDYRAIFIEDQTVAGTNYGIYQTGTGVIDFFAGDVRIGTDTSGAKLLVDQSSTTAAVPVLYLDQADISEEMIEFATTIGVGNAIEAVGAKTLTTTHFIKVTLPGGLTRYFEVGTIA